MHEFCIIFVVIYQIHNYKPNSYVWNNWGYVSVITFVPNALYAKKCNVSFRSRVMYLNGKGEKEKMIFVSNSIGRNY